MSNAWSVHIELLYSNDPKHNHTRTLCFLVFRFVQSLAPFLFWYIVCEPRCVCFNLAHQCHFAALFVRLVRPHCCANVDGQRIHRLSRLNFLIFVSGFTRSRSRATEYYTHTFCNKSDTRLSVFFFQFYSTRYILFVWRHSETNGKRRRDDQRGNNNKKKTKQKCRNVHRLWMCFFLR